MQHGQLNDTLNLPNRMVLYIGIFFHVVLHCRFSNMISIVVFYMDLARVAWSMLCRSFHKRQTTFHIQHVSRKHKSNNKWAIDDTDSRKCTNARQTECQCWNVVNYLGRTGIGRGRNKPKLPLVRRISDMLKTTCPPTCPLVRVLVHFVGT